MALVVYQGPQSTDGPGDEAIFPKANFVGLANQGATCYLNGLLQTLFMTPEFRQAIFRWNFDPAKDGAEEFCIPLQLQKLFGQLQLNKGKTRSVDTVALTHSFGWEGVEVFQQQDVQELTRVLFDALEDTFKGTEFEHAIDGLYAGELVDYIRCIDVDYKSERVDKFLDFSLAIVPFGSNRAMHSLTECIEMFLRPEILDGDNQYFCEQHGRKVDAIKGLKFGKLPYIMSVQLKRFVYDFSGEYVVQKKLNDQVRFPMVLDMNQYVATRLVAGELMTNENFEVFLKQQMDKLKAGGGEIVDPFATMSSIEDIDGFADPETAALPTDDLDDNLRYESMSDEEVGSLIDAHGEWIYELYAVLIHSGAITGGHYYAYIKCMETGKWFNFNDSCVTQLDEKTVQEAWGGKSSSTDPFGHFPPYKHSTCANAYMLMYRKVTKERLRTVANDEIPRYIHEIITREEEERLLRLKEEEEWRSHLRIKVIFKGKERIVPAKRSDSFRSFLEMVAAAWTPELRGKESLGEEVDQPVSDLLELVRLRDFNSYSKAAGAAFTPQHYDQTLQALGFSEYRVYLLENRSPGQEWEVFYVDGFNVVVEVFDHAKGCFEDSRNVRLPKLCTLGAFKDILVERNLVSMPRENLRAVKLISSGYSDGRYEILQGDGKKLREELVIYDGAKVCIEDDRTCLRATGEVDNDHSPAFLQFLENRNRMEVHCNRPNAEASTARQPHAYLGIDGTSFDTTLVVDARWTVLKLRQYVAETFALNPNRVRLFKQSLRGIELKDDKVALAMAGIYNNMNLAVSMGKAVAPGHFQLKLALYEAKGITVGTVALPILPPIPGYDKEGAPFGISASSDTAEFELSEYGGDATHPAAPTEDVPEAVIYGSYSRVSQCIDSCADSPLDEGDGSVVIGVAEPLDILLDETIYVDARCESPPIIADKGVGTHSQVEVTGFGERMLRYSVAMDQFKLLEALDDLQVTAQSLVETLRADVHFSLLGAGIIPEGFSIDCIRLRDRYGCNPGRILRDGYTFFEHQIYLTDSKSIAVELLPQPEVINDLDDTYVACQLFHRDTYELSPRVEVMLPGSVPVREIVRRLAFMHKIEPAHLRILVVPRDTDLYVFELGCEAPASNYGRQWIDPNLDGEKPLRAVGNDLSLTEGDLLILADASIPLMTLSEGDKKSVAIVEAAATNPYFVSGSESWGEGFVGPWPASTYDDAVRSLGSTAVGTSTGAAGGVVRYARSNNTGGIRIKTNKDRQRETLDSAASGASSPQPAADKTGDCAAGRGSPLSTIPTGEDLDGLGVEEREFAKQGGMAVFDGFL